MALVVDCYNLLHQTMPPGLAGLDEMRLCRLLSLSPWCNGRMVVVCDGNPKPFAPASPVEAVELAYSGQGRSADAVICEMIEQDTSPRRLTVVSSDREIQRVARRRRCQVLSSPEFVSILAGMRFRQDEASPAEARPTEPLPQEAVDQWLEAFGIDPSLREQLERDPELPIRADKTPKG